jgi:tRNA 2-thiouridine synthesizing protein B
VILLSEIERSDSGIMNVKQGKLDVFLLTKPPFSPRSNLCLKMAARSGNAKIYLAGDGVYHLLVGIEELLGCKVLACQEDLEARAIRSREKVTDKEKFEAPENFYAALLEDIMEHCERAYTF